MKKIRNIKNVKIGFQEFQGRLFFIFCQCFCLTRYLKLSYQQNNHFHSGSNKNNGNSIFKNRKKFVENAFSFINKFTKKGTWLGLNFLKNSLKQIYKIYFIPHVVVPQHIFDHGWFVYIYSMPLCCIICRTEIKTENTCHTTGIFWLIL